MNHFKYVRKIGLWVIVGLTLLTLLVLNVIQEIRYLNLVIEISFISLMVWLIFSSVLFLLNIHKRETK